jgi:hypothetical protein
VVKLLADENFHGDITRGLLRQAPDLNLVRAQDVGLERTPDPLVLEWAATHGRILLTHDRQTIPGFAFIRLNEDKSLPGVFVVDDDMPIGLAIGELLLAIECGLDDEWCNRVVYFPM